MTWLKTDDKFPEHRKIRRLSHGAFRLHVTAMCYAAHDETDGRLATDDIAEMQHGKSLARFVPELIAAGLWEQVKGGYRIHDFLDWNPSHAQLEAERAASRKRQAAARARRRGVTEPHDEPPTEDEREDERHGVSHGVTSPDVTRESRDPVPNRTDPFRTEPYRAVVEGGDQDQIVTSVTHETADVLDLAARRNGGTR